MSPKSLVIASLALSLGLAVVAAAKADSPAPARAAASSGVAAMSSRLGVGSPVVATPANQVAPHA